MCNVVRHKCCMDEDRERGRIAANATKRRQAVDYARSVLPIVREAVGANRRLDGSLNNSAVARWLNDKEVPTPSGKGSFKSETVSRLLYKTEESVRHFAAFEHERSVEFVRYDAENSGRPIDSAEIARLDAELERAVAEGVLLGRLLRCDDVMPPMGVEDAARLVVHQLDHHREFKRWDETTNFPTHRFDDWCVEMLRKALGNGQA